MELKRLTVVVVFPTPPLLIVPYGIETSYTGTKVGKGKLLIVPYGIETLWHTLIRRWKAFNRTLWN